jgi:hypothetical protein
VSTTSQKADMLLAWAQILLAFLFTAGIFSLVFFLLLSKNPPTGSALTIVGGVISALITVLTLQQNYFFARQRPPTLPDPAPSAPTLTGVFTNGPSGSPSGNDTTTTTLSIQPAPPGAPNAAGGRSA